MDLSSFVSPVIKIVYYILVGVLGLFSISSIYILNRYGKTRSVTIAVSLIYIFIFATILMNSLVTLRSI